MELRYLPTLTVFRKLYGIFVFLRAYGRRGLTDFYIYETLINFSPFDMLNLLQIIQLAS